MRGKYFLLLFSFVILSSAEVKVYRSLQDFLADQNSHRADGGDDNSNNGGDNSSSSTEIVDSRHDMVSSTFSQGHYKRGSSDNEGKSFHYSDEVDDASQSVSSGTKLKHDERQEHVPEDEEQDEDNEKENPVKTSDIKKNVFIYLPFRPTTIISQSTSTKSPFSLVNIVKSSTTRRPTFSTAFPTNRTRNLPVTNVITDNLSSRSSISLTNRGSTWLPISRNESLKASASRTHFVSSPALYYATSQQQHDTPSKTQVIHQERVVSDVAHQSPPHQVTVVESPPESRPVQLNVIQRSPETPPVQVNFVRHEAARSPVVVVNEPSPRVDVVKVHHHSPPLLVHAPPRILVRSPPIIHAPPPRAVIVHSPPPPPVRVVHHHAPPVHVVHHAPPVVRTHPVTLVHAPPPPPPPLLVHSPPPCSPPATVVHAPPPAIVHHPVVHAAPIVHHHHHPPVAVHAHPVIQATVPRAAFYSPAVPARTRTVYHSVQYLPEQTHVYTTTQFSPATRTTIYETDHVASYSNQHKVMVAAPPPTKFVQEPAPTIYHFPQFPSILGTRVLSIPIKIAGKILLKGHSDLAGILPSPVTTMRERRKKNKKNKNKKIFVFGADRKHHFQQKV